MVLPPPRARHGDFAWPLPAGLPAGSGPRWSPDEPLCASSPSNTASHGTSSARANAANVAGLPGSPIRATSPSTMAHLAAHGAGAVACRRGAGRGVRSSGVASHPAPRSPGCEAIERRNRRRSSSAATVLAYEALISISCGQRGARRTRRFLERFPGDRTGTGSGPSVVALRPAPAIRLLVRDVARSSLEQAAVEQIENHVKARDSPLQAHFERSMTTPAAWFLRGDTFSCRVVARASWGRALHLGRSDSGGALSESIGRTCPRCSDREHLGSDRIDGSRSPCACGAPVSWTQRRIRIDTHVATSIKDRAAASSRSIRNTSRFGSRWPPRRAPGT